MSLNCLVGDTLTFDAKNKGSDGNFYPSATPPVWALDDHTVAEFFQQDPQKNTIKLKTLTAGTCNVTVTTDQGDFTWNIVVADPAALTYVPYGESIGSGPVLAGVALAPGTVDLFDTFTAADNTLLSIHTPDTTPGGTWHTNDSSSEILSNAAANANAATTINHIDILAVVKAQLDFDVTIANHTGTNKVIIGFNSTAATVDTDGIQLTITAGAADALLVTDGTFTATVTGLTLSETTKVHYTIIYDGGKVTVLKGGTVEMTVDTALFVPTGTIAKLQLINAQTDGNVAVDNVKLQEFPVG